MQKAVFQGKSELMRCDENFKIDELVSSDHTSWLCLLIS